jgi:Domain of unknown function (DUF4823)
MHRVLIGLVALMIGGCADTHELIRNQAAVAPLSRQASAYVAVPADGSYGDRVYQGSGQQTAQAVADAFAPYLRQISVAETHESLEDAERSASDRDLDYVLYPEILHWEDRATEWSGKPDLISVRISVVQAESGTVLDSSIIKGKSKWATWGGDHPQDLLPPALEEYSAALFR